MQRKATACIVINSITLEAVFRLGIMEWVARRKSSRRGVSGLLSAIFLFAMLFTTGASYILFVTDSQFDLQASAKSALQRETQQQGENAIIDVSKLGDGDMGVSITNTGTTAIQIKQILIVNATSQPLTNIQSPTLPITLNVQDKTVTPIDTNVTIQDEANYTVKVITDRGSLFSETYPEILPRYALQAESSGSLTIDMSTFKYLKLTGNMQSGSSVGGYPTQALPGDSVNATMDIAFKITFTNRDPSGRTVTLWPGSSIIISTVATGYNYFEVTTFYVVDDINAQSNGLITYNSTKSYVSIPADTPVTLYFGARDALTNTGNSISSSNPSPFTALFTLTGLYSDSTFFGQTIPFPAGIITDSNAALSATSGNSGASITVTAGNNEFIDSTRGYIGWMDSTGAVNIIKTFTTSAQGGINTSFDVPAAATGYYTVIVSDYVNAAHFTFSHN